MLQIDRYGSHLLCIFVCWTVGMHHSLAKPNIMFILADDYGYADASFRGGHIKTPNIDRLARGGVILENYYVQPLCTPTRAAFLSGRFPINIGMQWSCISTTDSFGLHPSLPTIADALRRAGYSTHAIGKWHLGFCNDVFLPTSRGFDTFYGFLAGGGNYYTHETGDHNGYDWHHTINGTMAMNWQQYDENSKNNIDPNKPGCYSTHDLTYQVSKLIDDYPEGDGAKPLFLYLAFQAVHDPLTAPQQYVDEYKWMGDRSHYAGMVAAMDEAIGNVTHAFQRKGADGNFWKNTLLIFSTDNGGNIWHQMGNNYPLRGGKAGLFEGGTRAMAFVHGYGLKKVGYSNYQMMHVVDWFPTLLHESMASSHTGLKSLLDGTDGVDVWDAVMSNASSPRTQFVYNIEPEGKFTRYVKSGAVRSGCYKLLVGELPFYHHDKKQPAMSEMLRETSESEMSYKDWTPPESAYQNFEKDFKVGPLLYNVCTDPTERLDLYSDPSVKHQRKILEALLEEYRLGMVPVLKRNIEKTPKEDALQNNTWAPWGCDVSHLNSLKSEGQKPARALTVVESDSKELRRLRGHIDRRFGMLRTSEV